MRIPGRHKGQRVVSKVIERSMNFAALLESKMAISLEIKSIHALQPSHSTSGNLTLNNKNINILGHIHQDIYSSITWSGKK